MKRFEHTRYFRLLEPFLTPLLNGLRLPERYGLFINQLLLSGLLYLLADAGQSLLLGLISRLTLGAKIMEVFTSFVHIGTILTVFWCIWYALTLTFRMLNTIRLNGVWFTPRLLSCVVTAGITMNIGLRQGESLGDALWYYLLLGLMWAFACLRPTLFGETDG